MPATSIHEKQPGIRVPQLAHLLEVSEGTIRNDLSALEDLGQLTRVRGGAVLREDHRFLSPAFAERAQQHQEAKRWIARRAADMVEDGDSILLDASSTVIWACKSLRPSWIPFSSLSCPQSRSCSACTSTSTM